MASNNSLGTLTLDLVARSGGFVQGMTKAERSSKKWRRQVERDLKKLRGQFGTFAKVAAGAGAAGAGAFTIMAKQGLDFVDSQAKMARQVGASIDGLRGLQIAANDAGIDTNVLNGAVDRLNVRLGEARTGSGQAFEALEKLGLSADALARMDADKRIAAIADRVQELGLDSADTADLLRDLGIRNREMVNLLMAGGDGIREAALEVEEYGLKLSEVDAKKVEAANDAMSRIPRILEPIRNQIAINLAEPLTEASDLFNEAAKDSGNFSKAVANGMESAAKSVAVVLDQIEGVRKAFLKVRELDLNVQALLEKGQNALTPGEQPTPAMDALVETRAALAAIEAGETFLSKVSDHFEGIGDDIVRNEGLRAGVNAGLGMDGGISNDAIAAAGVVAGSFTAASDAANDSAEADKDKAEKAEKASRAVQDLGNAATSSARAMLHAAGRGGDPRFNIAAGGDTVEERARARFEASAFRPGDPSVINYAPNPTAHPTWSTDYLNAGAQKVNGAAARVGGGSGGGTNHTITFKVGDTEVGDVQGDEAFAKRLAEVLGGVASAS